MKTKPSPLLKGVEGGISRLNRQVLSDKDIPSAQTVALAALDRSAFQGGSKEGT